MKTTFILLLLVVTGEPLSQNYLYEKGASGFHIAGQLGASSGSTLLGIRLGYTFNGIVTLGMVLGSEHLSEIDINSSAIRPYIDYLVLKQGENDVPVSLNMGGHYQYNSFPKISGLSLSTFGFSVNLLHTFEAGKTTIFVPSIGVAWDRSTLYLLGIRACENTFGIGLSTAAKFNNFYLEPLISFYKGSTQFNLSVGIIIPN